MPNSRPAVGAIADVEVANGSTATRHVTVTDADASDTHTVTAASGDTSVATVSVTGKRVTVRGIGRGTATVTVRARDNSGAPNAASAARTFTATVPNSRPAVGAIADVGVANGSTATRDVTVTDADASDTHTVTASSGDTSVATVSVTGKRVTVRGVGRGTATVTVHATDDSGAPNATSAARTFTVTVPNSRPAVGAIADVGVANGSTATRDVTVTDADASDTHTVTASSGDTSVATVSVTGKRVTVRGIGRGTATATVTATDNSGAPNATSAARTFTVTVSNTRPAVASIANRTVSNGSTSAVDVTVTDADAGDAHTVTAASGDTSVATVTVSGKRVTVRGRGCGTATVTVHATDDSGAWNATSAARTFTATVPNDRPVVGPITGIEVANGSTATRDVTVTDDACGGVAHTLMAVSSDPSVATVTVTGNRITVRGVGRGTATITVKATDESGASNATSAPATFTATVPNSRPAVAAIADIDVSNGSTSAPVVTVTDADAGDTHTVTASSGDPSVATVTVTGKRVTVRGVGRGTATVTVRATDDSEAPNAASAARTFTATVPNSRPVLDAIADRMVSNAATSTFVVLGDMHAPTATSTIGVLVTDADARDRHALTATSTDLAVAGVGDREGRPTLIGVGRGTTTVTVWATDDSGESNATSTPATFTATVPNSPPAVAAIADWTVPTGATSTVHVLVTDADARDVHTLTATSTDTVVATVSATGTRLILTGLERGSTTIAVTATDDSGGPNATSSAVVFGVTVGNARPVVAPIADRTVANGVTDTVDVDVTDADADDAHTLSAGSDDNPTALAYATGGLVKVDALHRGTATVSVTATDDSGASNAASAPATFQVTVPNSRPAVGAMADRTVSNGAVHTVTVPVSDADAGDAHTLSASSDDTSVASVTTSGRYAYPRGVGRGTATITVKATDDSGAGNAESAPETFRATVPNSRPSVDAVTAVTVAVGETVTLEPGIADPDAGDTHTVAASSADASIATVAVSGTRLTITGVARGRTTATVAATDDSGGPDATSAARTFAVTVTTNSRPVVGALGDIELAAGTTRTATAGVTDADADDTHTVSANSTDLGVATVSVSGDEIEVAGVAAGTATITVTATDDSGAANATSEPATFAATVTGTSNRAPAVDPLGHVIVTQGAAVAVTVAFRDADGDAVTLTTVSEDPAVATVSATSTELALPASATSTDILLTGVSEGLAAVRVVATDGAATSTPVVFPVTVVAPPPAGPVGDLWVTPEVSGGDYVVGWSAPEGDLPRFWGLREVRETTEEGRRVRWHHVEGVATAKSFAGRAPGAYTYTLWRCAGGLPSCVDTGRGGVTVRVVGAPEVLIEPGTTPGTVPYGTGVTKGGDAYVNIPVSAVAGVNGLAPALSIDYSDARERQRATEDAPGDLLGYGWRVGGLSAIRRCVRDTADTDGIGLDGTDRLCIDGEPLVLVEGTHLQPDAEYRTLRESYARITVRGTAAAPWFEVETPDGGVREYGRTDDSRLDFTTFVVAGRAVERVPLLWSVNRETDAFGNAMTYGYLEDEASGVRHPRRIVYGNGGDAEVFFEYVGRHDLADVQVGGHGQRRWLRLQRIEVRLGGVRVREYRLWSEETPEGWRRLAKIQLCGWRDGGAGDKDCLDPFTVNWETPSATLPHMTTCVSGIADPLGRRTTFTRSVLTAAGSHAFVMGPAASPFGAATTPADARGLAGTDGNLKSVVTAVARGDGVGGVHRTTYAYQGRGWESTRNWGFLGFSATRRTDEASGVSTYTQYRLDFPHFASPAAVVVYDGMHDASTAEVLSKRYTAYAHRTIAHGGGASAPRTYLPYASRTTEPIREGDTLVGVRQTTEEPAFTEDGMVSSSVRTTVAGQGTASPATASVWGAAPSYAVTAARRTRTTTTYDNETTASTWLAGFPSRIAMEQFAGTSASATRTLELTRGRWTTPSGAATNAVLEEVLFPNDSSGKLTLTTTHAYDANGNLERTTVLGGNVTSRTTSAGNFAGARYPGTATNALGHTETLSWDEALGLPTSVTDANGRTLNVRHDAFGRELVRERVWDDVTETTSYAACGGSCGAVWATATACGTAGTVSADLAMKSTTTSPVSPETVRYYDELGRTVRTGVQSFGSATVHRNADMLHDGRGLVACASAPYHTGATKHFERRSHDARGRLTSLVRADGGHVAVAYAADAANHRVEATVTETVLDADGGTLSGRRKRVLEYDVLGDLVETAEGADAATARDRSVARYAYDGGGLLRSVTVMKDGAAAYATTFAHDAAGNRTGVTDPNFGTRTFVYTALGELRTSTDGRGKTMWTYDVLGRPTARTDPRGGVAGWVWDTAAKGLPARRTYDDGATSAVEYEEAYAYDAAARPTTVTTTIRTTATSTEAFTRSHGYDGNGRPSRTTHPSGLSVSYEYNARGYLSNLKRGSAALVTYAGMDAWGNTTRETYGNGVTTARTFDAATGRATGIDTAQGTAAFQDETYAWRSDGLLGRRAKGADREDFAYDLLGRLTGAEAYLDGSRTAGNLTAYATDAKTSDAAGDADGVVRLRHGVDRADAAGVGGAGRTGDDVRLRRGRTRDAPRRGHGRRRVRRVERPRAAVADHGGRDGGGRGAQGARRVPLRAGGGALPPADHLGGDPGGRHVAGAHGGGVPGGRVRAGGGRRARRARAGGEDARRTGAGGAHVGDVERAGVRVRARRPPGLGGGGDGRLGRGTADAGARPVRHAPPCGLDGAVAGGGGRGLGGGAGRGPGAVGIHGSRAARPHRLRAHERAALRSARRPVPEPGPDRLGAVVGAGLEPVLVRRQQPAVAHRPDGVLLQPQVPVPDARRTRAGGGFASGTATLLSRSLSWRVPIVLTVHWGPVSFGIGWGGFLNGGDDGGGYFGSFFGGFYRPYVSVGFGAPYPVVTSTARTVALGQEPVPADGPMALEPIVDIAADVGEWVFDFLIWDTVETGMQTYEDFRVGNYGDAAFGVVLTACDVVKACKIGGKVVKLVKRVPGVDRLGGWIRGKRTRMTGRVITLGGIPKNWIEQPAGKGRKYIDPGNPHNWVRVMPGNVRGKYTNSRVPYVRWQKDGRALDVHGNPVPRRSRASHIPVEDFRFDATLFE